jgi:hypothetical protein
VNIAAFSPDGARVVTAGTDGTARLWDAATGNPLGLPLKHDNIVYSAAFSPDGARVVTASWDGTVRLWDAATGNPLALPLKHDKEVNSAAFSPDGTRVVTASFDGTARLWDAATGNPLGLPLKHDNWVNSAAFSPDGARVVTASWDGTARLWNVVETGALSMWVEQATRCVARAPGAVGSSLLCPLSRRERSPAEQLARAWSLAAAGDRATFSHVWTVPRTAYQQAIAPLGPKDSPGSPSNRNAEGRDAEELRWAVSIRTAMLDAIEGHLPEARAHFGADAPDTDALLLNVLGGFAHEDLDNDVVALELLGRAHALNSEHQDILANLAEVYFAAGQYQDVARIAAKIDWTRASNDDRVALAALAWATAHLTQAPEGPAAVQLLHTYPANVNGARINWSWKGTKHALAYGHYRYEEVKLILDVLTLLEEPVTDKTRAQLAELLRAHTPTPSPKQ